MTPSIPDSLQTSRQILLHHAFTPLPSSSTVPHTLRPLGDTVVSIGPHYFSSTSLFLAEWTSSSAPSSGSAPPPTPTAAAAKAEITPALVARLNTASQSDPALAEIMKKAATGQATPEELGGLAKVIEGLRNEDGAPASPAAPAVQQPSVVLEFAENPGRKFLLPVHVLYTPLAPNSVSLPFPTPPSSPSSFPVVQSAPQDILLSLFLFPSERPYLVERYNQRVASLGGLEDAAAAGVAPITAPVPVDVVVHRAEGAMREGMWKAARNSRVKDSEVEGWWRQMIAAVPPRTYILHVPVPTAAELAAAAEEASAKSVGLWRTASEGPVASGSGLGGKRGGTPTAGGSQPPAKKAKGGARKKPAPRASRSRASLSNSLAGTPGASPSPSVAASPGPSSLAGSPAPEAGRKKPGPKKKAPAAAPVARRGSTRTRKKTVKMEEMDEDEEEFQ